MGDQLIVHGRGSVASAGGIEVAEVFWGVAGIEADRIVWYGVRG